MRIIGSASGHRRSLWRGERRVEDLGVMDPRRTEELDLGASCNSSVNDEKI
jgi:hypothetical protein